MLRQAEIDPGMLEDAEMRLPASSVIQLLDESARRSKCQSFAMLLAERRTYESLGPIVPVLERECTLRGVLDTTVRLRRTFNDVVGLSVVERGATTVIDVEMLPEFAGEQAITLLVAMAYVLLRGASRGTWSPHAVHLRRNTPADSSAFDHFFRAPVHFNSNVNGFECDSRSLDRCWEPVSLASENARLIERLESQISELRRHTRTLNDELFRELEEVLAEIRSVVGPSR